MSLDPKDANHPLTEREQKYVYEIYRLRALLDRLAHLQHTVDSLQPVQDRLRTHPLRGESDSLADVVLKVIDQLTRAEAVVEAARPFTIPEPPYGAPPPGTSAYKLFKALAAWEEGKA